MPPSNYSAVAHQLQQLFTQHYGAFRPDDFVAVAAELGFHLRPPSTAPTLSYHTQQPGAGYWATTPGAADIAEGMVWVSTEPTTPSP